LGCTLAEFGQRMSAKEYNLWIADEQIEPTGEERADLRAEKIVNSNLATFSAEGLELKDCYMDFDPPKKQDPLEWGKQLMAYTVACGGKVK